MIYIIENVALVHDNYITINRGDILVNNFDHDPSFVSVLRIVKNQRDF